MTKATKRKTLNRAFIDKATADEVRVVIANGANVNDSVNNGNDGRTEYEPIITYSMMYLDKDVSIALLDGNSETGDKALTDNKCLYYLAADFDATIELADKVLANLKDDYTIESAYSCQPLRLAAQESNKEIIKWFVANGAKVLPDTNDESNYRDRPALYSFLNSDLRRFESFDDVVELIELLWVDYNDFEEGETDTALHYAVGNDYCYDDSEDLIIKVIDYLINTKGIDVNVGIKDEDKYTPLKEYLTNKNYNRHIRLKIVKHLIDAGAKVPTDDENVSSVVGSAGADDGVVELLIENGLTGLKGTFGEACLNSNFNIARKLVENGSVDLKRMTGNTYFHCIDYGKEDVVEFLDFAIANGFNPNSLVEDGYYAGKSIIHHALMESFYGDGDERIVSAIKLLVKHGGDLNLKYGRKTCLDLAIERSNKPAIIYLINEGFTE